MPRFAELVQTMKEEPMMATIILITVLIHVVILVYGFMKLYESTSSNNNSSTVKPSGLSGKMKKFPGADEELKKLIREHKIE